VSNRNPSRWNRTRKLTLGAGVGGALAVLAATALPGAASAGTASTKAPSPATSASPATAAATTVQLSASPLGMNIAPWDPLYSTASSLKVLQPLLKKAGIDDLRYGGGVSADMYDWQTNTSIQNCPTTSASGFTAACATYLGLDFADFSKNARALGAQSNVTVNYGSGTPALAAAWVKHAKTTAGQAVAQWTIGNENYGCWETNNYLVNPPVSYKGYVPTVDATCPMNRLGLDAGMTAVATSYADNAKNFMIAMKQQNPSAQIGVPYAFDSSVGGASVGDNEIWNSTVLKTDAKYVNFVDAHFYPFGFYGTPGTDFNPTAQQVAQSVSDIPAEYAKIRSDLNAYDPSAKVTVGETGVSFQATSVACEPVGALFAAGDALSWLAAGAQSVDWWQLDTGANVGAQCTKPEEGMFSGGATPSPLSYYMGYYLAAFLAQPGAKLSRLSTTDNADVYAFQSVLPNGKVAVELINTDTGAPVTIKFSSALKGKLTGTVYRADDQNALNTRTLTGGNNAASVAGGIRLPAESILVLKEN
jgi:hypothetical protein